MLKNEKINLILSILAFISVLIVGCSGVSKMVTTTSKLGREIEELKKMSNYDVVGKVDPTITWERIQGDPEGILGQYCSLQGIVNLHGSKDFPINSERSNKVNKEGGAFILKHEDYEVFVISLEPVTGLKDGDDVVVVGLISESRLLKEMAEMYPKEKIPSLVTVLAKFVHRSDQLPPIQLGIRDS